MKVMFVSTHGGHLAHLLWLRSWWEEHARVWVVPDTPDTRDRLGAEQAWFLPGRSPRSPLVIAAEVMRASQILRKERPDVLMSAGAGFTVPYFLAAHLMGVPTVFLEVYDRVDKPTLTGRFVSRIATRVLVQWPQQARFYPGAVCVGTLR